MKVIAAQADKRGGIIKSAFKSAKEKAAKILEAEDKEDRAKVMRKVTPHRARHNKTSHLLNEGLSKQEVKDMMGWSSIEMVDRCPRVASLWDRKSNSLNVELFEEELDVMSSSERAMAQFFASVWFHNNTLYGFDLSDVASKLDLEDRKIIIDWISRPMYP